MKKKLLFILPWLPYPLNTGGHQAIFNGIIAVKDDFDIYITYTTSGGKGVSEKAFLQYVPNAHLLPYIPQVNRFSIHHVLHALQWRICGLFKERPSVDEQMCQQWMDDLLGNISITRSAWISHIKNLIEQYHFDIVQVEMPWLITSVLALPKDVKKVFVHHELGFVKRQLELQNSSKLEYAKISKAFVDFAEVGLLNLYDQIITLSTVDSEKLRLQGVTIPVNSSFSIVNTSDCQPVIGDGHHLVFIGPDSHSPNVAGIKWFLENCWMKLKEYDSNYRLNIIGNWRKENMTAIKGSFPDVEFLGFVDDLHSVIKGRVMIVPITIGSGIRMKILEACSSYVPFVSTTVGAEGIPVHDGVHCLLADDPEAFVQKILQLRDVRLQNELAGNAQKLIAENYSIEALRQNRLSIYSQI